MYLDAETYRMYFNNATNNCFEVDALIAQAITAAIAASY